MSIEGRPGPIPSGVYNGFSSPARTLHRGAGTPAGKVLMAGVAAASILGLGFGLFARPDVPDDDGMRLKDGEIVQIEVGPGQAPVVPGGPVQAAPLQTLPAGASAPTVVVTRGPPPPAQQREAVAPAEEAGTLDAQRAELAASDCSQAATPAERLACAGEAPEPAGRTMEVRRPARLAEVEPAIAVDAAEELTIPPPEFADEE